MFLEENPDPIRQLTHQDSQLGHGEGPLAPTSPCPPVQRKLGRWNSANPDPTVQDTPEIHPAQALKPYKHAALISCSETLQRQPS